MDVLALGGSMGMRVLLPGDACNAEYTCAAYRAVTAVLEAVQPAEYPSAATRSISLRTEYGAVRAPMRADGDAGSQALAQH